MKIEKLNLHLSFIRVNLKYEMLAHQPRYWFSLVLLFQYNWCIHSKTTMSVNVNSTIITSILIEFASYMVFSSSSSSFVSAPHFHSRSPVNIGRSEQEKQKHEWKLNFLCLENVKRASERRRNILNVMQKVI